MAHRSVFSFLTAAALSAAFFAQAVHAAPATTLLARVAHAQLRKGAPAASPMLVRAQHAHAQMRAATAAAATVPTMPANYYGMHVLHLPYGTVWPTVKFGTWRLWDAGVDWAQLQPTASTYNWQTLDTYIALAQQQKIDVLLELGQTPKWASSQPSAANAGGVAPPTSNTLWTNYVTAVATRYKGKIAYYEVWNEASSPNYWTGTPAQLVQLTALAAKAIKTVDPAAKIISPSLPNTNPATVAFLKSLLDLGLGTSVDVIGVHFYQLGKTPEAILAGTQAVQALLKQYKITKPVFNTEFGWAAPNIFNTVDDQSGYMMRSMLMGWTGGIQRFVWYAWDNSNWVTLTMSTPDFKTPTMVAKAYTNLQTWTVGKEVSPCVNTSTTIWSCDITDMSGDHSRIYWNTAGAGSVTPSLTWTPVHQVDMYGNVSAYTGGSLSISAHPLLITE